MNHILAALFAIGILFGIYTGLQSAADPDEVRGAMQQIESSVIAAGQATSPDAASAQLTAIDEPLSTLTGAADRLPPGYSERLTAFQGSVEALQTNVAAATDQSLWAAAAPSLQGLRGEWERVTSTGAITPLSLTVAAVSNQGKTIFEQTMDRAQTAVIDLAFPLIGLMAFWLGIMRVAEDAGLIQALARALNPFFRLFFSKVPKNHPANGAILMSLAANIIGLDNAATPLSLKAMKEMQTLNQDKETITNDQGMLLTLNATSITVIPFGIISYRLAQHSVLANDIILPALIATTCSTTVGVIIWFFVRRFSKDPAATGIDAERITAAVNAELAGETGEVK